MISIKDKVAIITGAANGIGEATAKQMAALGAKVVINDLNEDGLSKVASDIEASNGQVVRAMADISKIEGAEEVVEIAKERFGTVDILVNNAGIIRPAMIHKMSDAQWDQVIDVNLKGVFNCIKAVAPIFIERGKNNPEAISNGKIINVTSTAALTGTIGQINYSAAKSGVIGMTMSTAREWGRYRIQSNAVAFGVVETEMTETIRSEKFADKYIDKIVLNRFGKLEDVIPGIVFLASNGSDYITGHTLNMSGGSHIA